MSILLSGAFSYLHVWIFTISRKNTLYQSISIMPVLSYTDREAYASFFLFIIPQFHNLNTNHRESFWRIFPQANPCSYIFITAFLLTYYSLLLALIYFSMRSKSVIFHGKKIKIKCPFMGVFEFLFPRWKWWKKKIPLKVSLAKNKNAIWGRGIYPSKRSKSVNYVGWISKKICPFTDVFEFRHPNWMIWMDKIGTKINLKKIQKRPYVGDFASIFSLTLKNLKKWLNRIRSAAA